MDFLVANIDLLIQLGIALLALVSPVAAAGIARAVIALQAARRIESQTQTRFALGILLAAAIPRAVAYARERAPDGSLWETAAEAAEYLARTSPDLLARLGVGKDQVTMRIAAEIAEALERRDKAKPDPDKIDF